ncbi:MAG TPA: ABC transporter substrate-binding protein [Candidatus Dormibacteraeota bacterium]|nr:ABC transporter substrate-binding protein [Candidatus Dormibacteraeota bacterium]
MTTVMQLQRRRPAAMVVALAMSLGIALAACGGNTGSAGGATGSTSGPISKCGLGNGKKATGTPIKLGAIVTKQPGTDFTPITGMAQAYFSCVNDNGGINGRPIQYIVDQEQSDPQQVHADAVDLIQNQGILAMVGNTSLIDCSVNNSYYQQQGFYVIGASIEDQCHTSPNYATVNMGPNYSTEGAVQYVVSQGAKKVIIDAANVPGGAAEVHFGIEYAQEKGLATHLFLDDVPITDASGIALRDVQEAGPGGAVVLNFTPPEGLKIVEAAEQQGLIDRVKWGWSTPGNDASVAQALDAPWNGKLGINAELSLVTAKGPDTALYRQVQKKYAPSIALGSFSEMGFVAAEIVTKALLQLPPDQLTKQGVNTAIRNIKNFKTDILCKPWYYGDLPYHVPNNTDLTVTPVNHVMVQKQGCFEIAALPDNNLAAIRSAEVSQHLNTA